MTEQTRLDRVLPGLFDELAAARTPDYLEAAIDRASSRPQRPAWTYPGRWLPMQITTGALPTAREPWRLIFVLALIGLLIALAIAAYVGSLPTRPTLPAPAFGPAGNGVIALAKDGDIIVADRPSGDLRPLVTGPEYERDPMFSPDGTKLAFMRSQDAKRSQWLVVADANGTNAVNLATLESLEAASLGEWRFAPDSRSFMNIAQIGGEMRFVIRPVDPAAAPTFLNIRVPCCWFSWGNMSSSPTNPQEILFEAQLDAEGRRGLYVYDLVTRAIRTIVDPALDRVDDAAWLPDGEHIIYTEGPSTRVVAADGSGDQVIEAWRGRVSPVSNDGTMIVAERDGEGEQTGRPVIVPISGDGEPIVIACGPETDIECPAIPMTWIWSPDDSMLIAMWRHEVSVTASTPTYLLVDAHTGQVTKLDWRDVGSTPIWQRVAP